MIKWEINTSDPASSGDYPVTGTSDLFTGKGELKLQFNELP